MPHLSLKIMQSLESKFYAWTVKMTFMLMTTPIVQINFKLSFFLSAFKYKQIWQIEIICKIHLGSIVHSCVVMNKLGFRSSSPARLPIRSWFCFHGGQKKVLKIYSNLPNVMHQMHGRAENGISSTWKGSVFTGRLPRELIHIFIH